MERVVLFIATGAYSGYSPVIPGTVGTLVGIGIFLIFYTHSPFGYVAILLLLFFLAVFISDKAENILQEKDSKHIVIDEIFGFMVAMAFLPNRVLYIVLGFFFFRLFDILKIFPANRIERKFKNGYGVVLDDLIAGVYTNLLLQGLRFLKS
ncbi:MAG: phosphatidylglycerophosphatase A [Thermodesulfobacteriota bacterium]|nr:phosphatidylglycerophosphatase A [Thermodesulfobacteriota bacterium]